MSTPIDNFKIQVDEQITNQTTEGSVTPTIVGDNFKDLADILAEDEANIATNTEDIATYAGDIAINTNNIAANTSAIAGKQDALGFTPEDSANKGQVNGYASLGSDGLVPADQLPPSTEYTLPVATDIVLGGVKQGNQGTSIDGDGVLNLEPATTEHIGGVYPGDNTIQVDEAGAVIVPKATSGSLGVVQIGDGLTVDENGVVTADGGGGGITALTFNGTRENPSISGSTLNIPNMFGGVWQKFGTVLIPDLTSDQNTIQEATVMYETSPQILTGAPGSVFKMWFTQGYDTPNICYAESYDGLSWTRLNAVTVVTGHARSCVIKVGSTYIMYASLGTSGTQIDQYTSSNGVTWTLAHSAVISVGGVGTWNHQSISNCSVYYDGTTYHMLLEGISGLGAVSKIGYFHSTDGFTFTEYGSNPVLTRALKAVGNPYLTKIGSTFYAWTGGSNTNGSNFQGDLYAFSSPDMITWTARNSGNPVITRTMADEGLGAQYGMIADPTLVEINGKTYMYYSAAVNGNVAAGCHIRVAIANYTFANLVGTNEGDGGQLNVAQIDAYDKVQSDLKYAQLGSTYQTGPFNIETPFSGFGVRYSGTPTTQAGYLPDLLAFNRSGGVSNVISGGGSGLNYNTWQSHTFQYRGATIANIDNAGNLGVNSVALATTPSADFTGGAFSFLGNFSGTMFSIPAKTIPRVWFTNNGIATINNTAETTLIPGGVGSLNPASLISIIVGLQWHVNIEGIFSTTGTPGNLTVKFKMAGITLATAVLTGLPASATNLRWRASVKVACTTAGATPVLYITGVVYYSVGDNLAELQVALNNGGSSIANTAFASQQTIDATGQFASSGNSITTTQFSLVTIN